MCDQAAEQQRDGLSGRQELAMGTLRCRRGLPYEAESLPSGEEREYNVRVGVPNRKSWLSCSPRLQFKNWGMHLTPDDPISCGRAAAPVARVGDHLASVVGPRGYGSLRRVAGRWRLNRNREGETLYKLLQRARVALHSPDTRSWGFGSQVHTPIQEMKVQSGNMNAEFGNGVSNRSKKSQI